MGKFGSSGQPLTDACGVAGVFAVKQTQHQVVSCSGGGDVEQAPLLGFVHALFGVTRIAAREKIAAADLQHVVVIVWDHIGGLRPEAAGGYAQAGEWRMRMSWKPRNDASAWRTGPSQRWPGRS